MPRWRSKWLLNEMERAYDAAHWSLPPDFLGYDNYRRVLKRLEFKSSPGYPWSWYKPTIGELLGWDGVSFDETMVASMWFEVQAVIENRCDDDYGFILRGFIKQEPHSTKKINEGRFRMIMASPIQYQIVWHMLFDFQNDLEIEKAYHIPSQQGMALPGGRWKIFLAQWRAKGYDTGLDKTAWDWTAPAVLLRLDLHFRRRMCLSQNTDEWFTLASRMYTLMFAQSKIVLSDGTLYQQQRPGIMKSGCVNTISTNSHLQVMIHLLACKEMGVNYYPLPSCCGDDTLQKKSQVINFSAYEKYGAIVKSASDGLEFVGHKFDLKGPIPLYNGKHLAKALTVPSEILPEYLDSMARMYAHDHVMFDFWVCLAEALGMRDAIRSKASYAYWYDYEDLF